MSEEQIKDMLLKQCLELTTNNDLRPPISAYNGVDIDDVVNACKQLQDKKTYIDLVKENELLKKENKILRENAEHNDKVVDKVNWKNQLLKKQLEERPKEYVFIGNAQNKTRDFINQITKDNKEYKNQQKEFIEYMNKTIKECNNYSKYIEKKTKELHGRSCGKTYIANEIMKNEVSKKVLKEILSKYKEIIGDDK